MDKVSIALFYRYNLLFTASAKVGMDLVVGGIGLVSNVHQLVGHEFPWCNGRHSSAATLSWFLQLIRAQVVERPARRTQNMRMERSS